MNGYHLGDHIGGHLPFEFPINPKYDHPNILTVAVNNTLSHETIPQAEFKPVNTFDYNGISFTPKFDFFNYAGILRSVYLLKLPTIYIEDIELFVEENGQIDYKIELNQKLMPEYDVEVLVYKNDQNEKELIWKNQGIEGNGKIEKEKFELWWPRGMGKQNLYIFQVSFD